MSDSEDGLAIALFSEIFMADQLARAALSRALPQGMELSHFSVLNLLARSTTAKSPAQMARAFHVTRGAMTNTLGKLEWAGYVHISPDWEDARRKLVAISPAGLAARNAALEVLEPILQEAIRDLGNDKVRAALPVLRKLRRQFEDKVTPA